MSWTKRQFVQQAFDEIGLAPYIYETTPDQVTAAVQRLDSMMATWDMVGICLGYPFQDMSESPDVDADTRVPDAANEAISLNLAVRLAPGYGKTVSIETKIAARTAYNALLACVSEVVEQRLPGTLPLGAGNRRIGVFVTAPDTLS